MTEETFLLDLLNSTPVVDGAPRDELDAAWLRARGGRGTPGELAAVAAARDVLQGLVRGSAAPSAPAPPLDGVHRPAAVGDAGAAWEPEAADARRPAVRAVRACDAV